MSLERSPRRWDERYARVCRRHRDLIGVWESPDSAYALLLSDTLVPLSEEHRAWLKRTRDTARAIMRELRASGLQRPMFVLQWWPYERIAEVLETWSCCYDGDPARRAQHARVVAGQLADRHFMCSRRVEPRVRSCLDDEPAADRGRTPSLGTIC